MTLDDDNCLTPLSLLPGSTSAFSLFTDADPSPGPEQKADLLAGCK